MIKRINYNQDTIPIILQNENGPCPLLALMNVLLLRKDVVLHDQDYITTTKIVEIIAEFILQKPSHPEFETSVHDCLEILPLLETGMDINIYFQGIESFEFTRNLTLFDICSVRLFHGWVVDPLDMDTFEIIVNRVKSFNKLVEIAIEPPDEIQGMICNEFLHETRTQLTSKGLRDLQQIPSSPSVLFRNNHFHVLFNHNQQLYTLVTDQGFADSSIVWESLSISGDSFFVTSDFNPFINDSDEQHEYVNTEYPGNSVPEPQPKEVPKNKGKEYKRINVANAIYNNISDLIQNNLTCNYLFAWFVAISKWNRFFCFCFGYL
jgi:hypothetical protein